MAKQNNAAVLVKSALKLDAAAVRNAVLSEKPILEGSSRRWICDVWMSHEELLQAHREGLVILSRCDLPTAFQGEDFAKDEASKLSYLNAEFHFVEVA